MKRHIALILLAGLTVMAADAPANPPPAYEGMRLFASYCQLCHGPRGKGDGPLAKNMGISPADLTKTIRSRSDTILKKIISGEGRQTITGRDRHDLISDAMPEWKDILGDAQIEALIAWLRFLGTSKHGLMGDPADGARLYRQYCTPCHGEDGSGDGVMAGLIHMYPADHTNPIEMNLLDNEELAKRILRGSGKYMPAWEGILSQAEVESLVSYIRMLAQ